MRPSDSKALRTLLERHGNRCQSCGVEDVPLDIAHIVPTALRGQNDRDNLAVLCRDCRHLLQAFRPSGLEFERFLSSVLSRSPHYGDVVAEAQVRTGSGARLVADLAARRLANEESILVEAKTWSSLRRGHIRSAIEQINRIRDHGRFDTAVLAFPGRLPEEDYIELQAASIEAWDLDYVAREFSAEIEAEPPSGLRLLYLLVAKSGGRSTSDSLITRLKHCRPGKDWVAYQRVIADVLEFLFSPPLTAPIWECADAPKANRRDFILPNYATEGFWRFARESYNADYVVVDAKNHKKRVKKSAALQMANYLKPRGTGMFGVIATRCGANDTCLHTIAEQWTLYGKMIVVLTDGDVEAMLLAAGSASPPEDVIGEKIQAFRLSL